MNRMFKTIAFVIFLVAALMTATASAAVLEYKHQAGQADIVYQMQVTRGNLATQATVTRHVDSVVGSTITLTTSFANTQMVRGGIAHPLAQMDGAVSQTVMDNRGNVTSVTPLGNMATQAQSVGATSLDQDLLSSFAVPVWPTADLAVNDQFTRNATQAGVNATFTYTVQGLNVSHAGYNDCAQIAVASTFTVNTERENAQIRDTAYILGNVNITGTIYFSVGQGRVVESNIDIDSDLLNVSVDFNGKARIAPSESAVNAQLLIQ